MTVVVLSIPFPVSNNAIWRSVKGRNILTKRYREWREVAAAVIDSQMRTK